MQKCDIIRFIFVQDYIAVVLSLCDWKHLYFLYKDFKMRDTRDWSYHKYLFFASNIKIKFILEK